MRRRVNLTACLRRVRGFLASAVAATMARPAAREVAILGALPPPVLSVAVRGCPWLPLLATARPVVGEVAILGALPGDGLLVASGGSGNGKTGRASFGTWPQGSGPHAGQGDRQVLDRAACGV